jgi:WD40 repeat protein/uncharacterized caspase-like protein
LEVVAGLLISQQHFISLRVSRVVKNKYFHCWYHKVFGICLLLLLPHLLADLAGAENPAVVVQTGHLAPITCVAFRPDGRVLATGSPDKKIKLWDVSNGLEFRTIHAHAAIEALAFSENGDTLLYATEDGQLTVWDVGGARELRRFGTIQNIVGSQRDLLLVALSQNGSVAAETSFQGGEVSIWNTMDGKKIVTLQAPTDSQDMFSGFTALALNPDGSTLAGVLNSGTIKLWNARSGRLLQTIRRGNSQSRTTDPLVFSSNGGVIAFTDAEGVIRLCDAVSGRTLKRTTSVPGEILALSFSSNSNVFASLHLVKNDQDATESRSVRLWNSASGKELRKIELTYGDDAGGLAFNPQGNAIALLSGDIIRGQVTLRDTATGRVVGTFAGQTSPVWAIGLTASGNLIASHGWGENSTMWATTTGLELESFETASLSVSADGKTLAGQVRSTGEIRLWDSLTKSLIRSIPTGSSLPRDRPLLISPDGTLVAIGGRYDWLFRRLEGQIKIWDAETGKPLHTLADSSSAIAFDAKGKHLAGSVYNSQVSDSRDRPFVIRIWNTSTGKELPVSFTLSSPATALVFSPNGEILAVALADNKDGYLHGKITLLDTATGQSLQTLEGFTGTVDAIAFNHDGKIVLGGDVSGEVKSWNVSSGKELKTFNEHSAAVTSIVFSRDGKHWISSGRDGLIITHLSESGAELVRQIVVGEGDYVIVTADGYYLATRSGASKALAFRFGNHAFPFEQFDLKLNRPDLVLQKLGAAPDLISACYKTYQRRLRLAGFREQDLSLDLHQPEVAITTNELPLTTSARVLTFKLKATDSRYQLARLNVFLNGSPLYGPNGLSLKESATKMIEREVSIELSGGLNRVRVLVVNEKGAQSAAAFGVNYDGPIPQSHLYVLAVGVSEYTDTRYNLTYAAKDAADIVQVLERRVGHREQALVVDPVRGSRMEERPKSFYQAHSLKLLDKDATREKILKARDFLLQAKVEDEVVVFFAGHGLLDAESNYYFGTTDIDFAKPGDRGLKYEDIENLLDGVVARRKLILIDTCHSGEVDKEETKSVPAIAENAQTAFVKSHGFPRADLAVSPIGLSSSILLLQELFADLRQGSGAAVISASGGLEFAYEHDEWRNGVFTYSVIDGLRNSAADMNSDGVIRVSELRNHVATKVRALTQGKQTPTGRRENLDYDFRVY